MGSHTCLILLRAGNNLVELDDFNNNDLIAFKPVPEPAEEAEASLVKMLPRDIDGKSQLDNAFAEGSYQLRPSSISQYWSLKRIPCKSSDQTQPKRRDTRQVGKRLDTQPWPESEKAQFRFSRARHTSVRAKPESSADLP